MAEISISINNDSEARNFFGNCDENLRAIERSLGVNTSFCDGVLKVRGDDGDIVATAEKVMKDILLAVRNGSYISTKDICITTTSFIGF